VCGDLPRFAAKRDDNMVNENVIAVKSGSSGGSYAWSISSLKQAISLARIDTPIKPRVRVF